MRFTVQTGKQIAGFRDGAQIGALNNLCAHRNETLGEGHMIDGCITCRRHGYHWLADGCAPPPFPERLVTYRVCINRGMIEVDPRPRPPGIHASITDSYRTS